MQARLGIVLFPYLRFLQLVSRDEGGIGNKMAENCNYFLNYYKCPDVVDDTASVHTPLGWRQSPPKRGSPSEGSPLMLNTDNG